MTLTFKHSFSLLILCSQLFFGCVHKQGVGLQDGSTTNSAAPSKITVKKVKRLLDNQDEFILIDTRSADEYASSHLPTAISIPICGMKNLIDRLPEDKDQLLVFYCGWSGCSMTTAAADTAAQGGYTNIKVMMDGIGGWTGAEHPTFAVDDFVLTGNLVLIDLRAARKDTVQRIPRSVSIPFDTLEDRVEDISKKAPIVVYSDTVQESHAALSAFRMARFTRVSMVEGNLQGWKQRGMPLTSGPITTKINWTRKPGKGEVSVAEFKKVLTGRMNAVILDVRTNEEVAAGKMKNSIHIPLDELVERMNELPKNKKIFIYCSHGPRADMASSILKENGFSSFFLATAIKCEGNDCVIENQ